MAQFNFTLDSIEITNTRSKHEDTDYVLFTLKLGSLQPQFAFHPMGNVNNGTHPLGLLFGGIEVAQDDSFILNYLVVNAGSASGEEVRMALRGVSVAWANGRGPAPPPLTTADGADKDWFAAQLKGIFRSQCDGVVASEQNHFTYGDLMAKLANGPFSHRTPNPGTRSPGGCGDNSQYTVNWHLAKAILLPNVVGAASDTPGPPPVPKSAADLLKNSGFAPPQWEQGTKGPLVAAQTPNPGFVDVGTRVTLWRGHKPQ